MTSFTEQIQQTFFSSKTPKYWVQNSVQLDNHLFPSLDVLFMKLCSQYSSNIQIGFYKESIYGMEIRTEGRDQYFRNKEIILIIIKTIQSVWWNKEKFCSHKANFGTSFHRVAVWSSLNVIKHKKSLFQREVEESKCFYMVKDFEQMFLCF